MDLLTDTVAWFADPEQWSGRDGIPFRFAQHLWLAIVPTVIAAALALPSAAWLAHRRKGEVLANAVVNIGRAIPSFGVIVFLAVAFIQAGRSAAFWPLVLSMVLLALPPMFTNTYTGIADVDPALVEAARGMGYDETQVLRRVELPAATPVILAGVRIAFVQVVATVALGAVIQGRTGGFGVYIINGFSRVALQAGKVEVLAGALLVALLTIGVERLMTLLERRVLPRGLRPARAGAGAAT